VNTKRDNVIAQYYFLELWKYRQFEELNLPATTASQTRNERENHDYVQQFDTQYEKEK
jgi:hypothetical protein